MCIRDSAGVNKLLLRKNVDVRRKAARAICSEIRVCCWWNYGNPTVTNASCNELGGASIGFIMYCLYPRSRQSIVEPGKLRIGDILSKRYGKHQVRPCLHAHGHLGSWEDKMCHDKALMEILRPGVPGRNWCVRVCH